MTPDTPDFLDVEDVLALHALQLGRYGGGAGIRDRGLLESALAQPQGSFGGQWIHADIFAMAAAYLFHIVKNHPFVDGNKRTALLAALVFLDHNGISIETESPMLHDLTLGMAEGRFNKDDAKETLRRIFENQSR